MIKRHGAARVQRVDQVCIRGRGPVVGDKRTPLVENEHPQWRGLNPFVDQILETLPHGSHLLGENRDGISRAGPPDRDGADSLDGSFLNA